MSRNYFGPGNSHATSSKIRKIIKNVNDSRGNIVCNCFQETVNKSIRGYNDDTQTQAERNSQLVNTTLGGRIMFGNNGTPFRITYLGGIEGQVGGSPKPLRNNF